MLQLNCSGFNEEIKVDNSLVNNTEDLGKAKEKFERQINGTIARLSKTRQFHHMYSLSTYLQELLKQKNKANKKNCRILHQQDKTELNRLSNEIRTR